MYDLSVYQKKLHIIVVPEVQEEDQVLEKVVGEAVEMEMEMEMEMELAQKAGDYEMGTFPIWETEDHRWALSLLRQVTEKEIQSKKKR